MHIFGTGWRYHANRKTGAVEADPYSIAAGAQGLLGFPVSKEVGPSRRAINKPDRTAAASLAIHNASSTFADLETRDHNRHRLGRVMVGNVVNTTYPRSSHVGRRCDWHGAGKCNQKQIPEDD